MSKRPLKMTMRHPNQTKLGLSKNYFANDVPVSVVDVELSRGEICVANLKAPSANGVSLGSYKVSDMNTLLDSL